MAVVISSLPRRPPADSGCEIYIVGFHPFPQFSDFMIVMDTTQMHLAHYVTVSSDTDHGSTG